MRKPSPLHRFDAAVQAFISSRRALGRAIRLDEYVLRRLRAYLARARYSDLDAESFERWRGRLRHCAHNTQVDWAMMVYRFCRYRRRRESRCFLPQRWTLGHHRPYPLPTPIEADQVRRLLDFIGRRPSSAGRALSYAAQRLAIVLMYTAGLRRGEVARLRMEDVDVETGVMRIVSSKFHKSRWVPLSPSATRELRAYLRWQDDRHVKGLPLLFPTSVGSHRTPASFKEPMRRCAERAGIEKHLTSHVLRRTANNLLRQSAGDLVARAVTGHVTAEMTERYSVVDHDERTKALRGAFGSAFVAPVQPLN